MLVFSVLWLWFFRSDYRFPRALLLVPIGVSVMFLLNVTRIAILILIGDGGAPTVATGGFHSQAGWIAFNGVALVLASVTHRCAVAFLDADARDGWRAACGKSSGSIPRTLFGDLSLRHDGRSCSLGYV